MISATAMSPLWREVKASYALVERNVNLSKRYWGWEVAFLVYSIAQSMAVVYIAKAPGAVAGTRANADFLVLYLSIGALTWSYMATLFQSIAESVQWERWEGTIEYSMMAPISRLTYVLGSCLFGVVYGIVRTTVVTIVLVLAFSLSISQASLIPALVIVGIGSLSFVGIGIMAATLPLLFTEKGAQMTFVIEALLLLISGVYYPISVLPAWVQPISHLSPATYVLEGTRDVVQKHAALGAVMGDIIPLVIIGVVTIPLGILLWTWAENFAKRTGRLKRTG